MFVCIYVYMLDIHTCITPHFGIENFSLVPVPIAVGLPVADAARYRKASWLWASACCDEGKRMVHWMRTTMRRKSQR